MATTLFLFEDERTAGLEPLISTTPAWDLLLGTGSLAEMLPVVYREKSIVATRQTVTLNPGQYLFINGRILFPRRLAAAVSPQGPDMVFLFEDDIAALRLSITKPVTENILTFLNKKKKELRTQKVSVPLGRHLWHYLYSNEERLEEDAANLEMGVQRNRIPERVALVAPESISIGSECKLAPGGGLDASKGPIIIGKRVNIMANAVIIR